MPPWRGDTFVLGYDRSTTWLGRLHTKARWEGECLVWQAYRDRAGYGRTCYEGRRSITAHRASWLAHGRTVPEGTEIDHICRNRACVNVEHLRCVPHRTNLQNRVIPLHECKRCGTVKAVTSGGKRVCKVCRYAGVKRWRERNPWDARELANESKRRWRAKHVKEGVPRGTKAVETVIPTVFWRRDR